ncbi:kinase-like domain-containing protein [Epithele typhae]|uniref:kinase-like domain-containing protein n=1 Tax=Epithele typhae TaxID=378194 RepID=UPI002007F6FD|nr:kinase-like domain-containing protein [Epithele typhae]KAH9913955.1 kinase-like domain-containing protein [Epithele typhae]
MGFDGTEDTLFDHDFISIPEDELSYKPSPLKSPLRRCLSSFSALSAPLTHTLHHLPRSITNFSLSPSSPPFSPPPFASPPTSTPARTPKPPRSLTTADFLPLRMLGRGGHGTVYLVQDTVSEKRLAMKVIAKNGLPLRDYPAIFCEQALGRAFATQGSGAPGARGGDHTFAPLRGSFEDTDNFYLLTDYYPRGDLMQWLKRHGTAPAARARAWCAELLVALERLHARRVVHRDVKPDNVMLADDGRLVLADFGIARDFAAQETGAAWSGVAAWDGRRMGGEAEEGGGREVSHALVGTPGYIAPEVYSGCYSYAVDVWGAGVVLYCMLTGKLPFGLLPKTQGLAEIIDRTDCWPATFGLDDVDPKARDLLTKMLEKNPTKRPSIRKLKKHPWFRGVDWKALEAGIPTSPERPTHGLEVLVTDEVTLASRRPNASLLKPAV